MSCSRIQHSYRTSNSLTCSLPLSHHAAHQQSFYGVLRVKKVQYNCWSSDLQVKFFYQNFLQKYPQLPRSLNLGTFGLQSSTLPLSHCTPRNVSYIKVTVDCVCIYWGPHGRLATTCTYFVCAKCSYPKKRLYLLVALTQIWFDSKQFNIPIYLVWIYCFTSQSTVMVKSGLSVHLATHFSWASLTKQLISTSLISE